MEKSNIDREKTLAMKSSESCFVLRKKGKRCNLNAIKFTKSRKKEKERYHGRSA